MQRLLQEPVIESVLKSLLKRTMPKVEKPGVEIISAKLTGRESLRGRNHNKRRSYSAVWKREVLQESESGQNNDETEEYGINRA